MKFILVLILTLSCYIHAQEPESQGSTVNTEDPENFKSSLIQEIVAIPVQKAESEGFFTWDKAILQIGYGQSYFRFNPYRSDDQSISTFSDGGDDLNLRAQYYLFSFFSLIIDYEFTQFKVERFDGQQINQTNRVARSLGYGFQFDLGDFIIGFLDNTWNKPFYIYEQSLTEQEYNANVYSYKLGHRTGVKNVIIEFFYYYHDVNPFELDNFAETSGKIQTLGIEIFLNTRKTFGLHFSESFGDLNTESNKFEFKQLKLQPFYRF